MPGIEDLSDAELAAMAGGGGAPDITKLSDAELAAMAGGSNQGVGFTGPAAAGGIGSKRTSGLLGMFSVPNIVQGLYETAKAAPEVTKQVMTGQLDPTSAEGIKQVAPLAGLAVAPSPGRAVMRAPAAPQITPELTQGAAKQGYKAIDALDVQIVPSAVQSSINQTTAALAKRFDPDLAPGTYGILSKEAATVAGPGQPAMGAITGVQRPGPRAVTSMDLDSLRQRLSEVARGDKPIDAAAATSALRRLDDAWEALPQTSFVKGKAGEFTDLLKSTRGDYAASKRHEALDNLFENAERQAATGGSGANLQNSLRQAVKSFIKTDANSESAASRAGFNEAEIAQLDQFSRKGGSNTLRRVGNMTGGGGGIGSMIAAMGGAATLGPAGGFLPVAGMGIKGLGNKMAQRQAGGLLNMTLQRSPLAEKLLGSVAQSPIGAPQVRLPPPTLGLPAADFRLQDIR